MSNTTPSRVPPSPLPVEPYFREIPGSESFLQAIAEEPDDDDIRLVFADWLEDQGHSPRAEFIRVQCELARGFARAGQRRGQLQRRQGELYREHCRAWQKGLLDLTELSFARGMLESLPLKRFVALSPKEQGMLDIRTSTIDVTTANSLRSFLQCPRLGYLVTLESRSRLGPDLFRVLAACTTLTGLRHLNLFRSVKEAALGLIRTLSFLAQLKSLNLGYSRIGDSRFLALLASPKFPCLERLELELCHLGDASAEAIAASEKLAGLRVLDLSRNEIVAAGGRAIATSPHMRSLTHLNFVKNNLGTTARQWLADASHLPALTFLALDGHTIEHHSGVGLARVREWARHAAVSRPTHLDLTDAGMTTEAFQTLVDSPAFEQVRSICLKHALVKPSALNPLIASPQFAHIESLDLSSNRLSASQARTLAQSPYATGLKTLNLECNQLSLHGVDALVTSPSLQQLEHLSLAHNHPLVRLIEHSPRFAHLTGSTTPGKLTIDYQGILPDDDLANTLAASPYLADFTHLLLSCWRMTEEGLTALASSPHTASLTHLTLTQCWNHSIEAGIAALVRSPYLDSLEHLEISHMSNKRVTALIKARWPKAIVRATH